AGTRRWSGTMRLGPPPRRSGAPPQVFVPAPMPRTHRRARLPARHAVCQSVVQTHRGSVHGHLAGASSLGWQHLAWPTVASVWSPRARGDDAAFAQQTLLQSSRDRAVAASGRGSLVLGLFWLPPSVLAPAGVPLS